ncbi:MAG TPA: carboxymuconolactone decarboxylase family protein [Candidatus Saccharimonadales bacterium]|nr:carboxymuconolactone decarboxylase family protein [Candidatus Saccharimonadales bacterium]
MERPAFIEKMELHDSDFGDQVRGLSNMLMTDGALPAKTKMLMTLLGEALVRRDGGVKLVAGVARNVGVTDAEINETIRLAFLIGGLPALASATNAYPDPAP